MMKLVKRKNATIHNRLLTLEEVLPLLADKDQTVSFFTKKNYFCTNGTRIQTFLAGCDCVVCGAKGSHFQIERCNADGSRPYKWHLNLYAKKENGTYVLMTSDHIIPRSKGGPNTLENRQPMCRKCNGKKGDKIPKIADLPE